MAEQQLKDVAYVRVDFSPDPGFELDFKSLNGTEELGRPFLFHLEMSSGELRGDVGKLIGSTAKVKFVKEQQPLVDDDLGGDKYLHGIVTRVLSQGVAGGAYQYSVELRPWIWLLTRSTDCRIFQNKSPFDIVTQLFRDEGFSDFEDKRQNAAGGTTLDYCVQYRETTFDFVTRLMEEFGFYYYFKHDEQKHTLVFADDPNAHTELSKKIPFQFDITEFRSIEDHIWDWSTDYNLHSGKYMVRDYNFTKPSADLTARTIKTATHKHGSFEVYEYPGPYEETDIGQKLSDVRMQAIAADRAMVHGVSNCRKLHAGWKFQLDKYPDKPVNRDYLITRSEITTSIAEGLASQEDKGEKLDTYRTVIRAIPGDVPFRLHRRTPRPMIRGPQTAKVVGASGDEITTDEYGRVKVKFHWDRSDTQDDQRTCWIRVAQSWAGAGFGAMFIPRVGMEVVVEFLEGNPDRPLITGVVYNANQKVPYSLPGDKTKTTLKTNSSTGGGGFNEFRFEDEAGNEEVFFKAQKDYNKKVLNNETVSIKNDTTTTVEQGNRAVTVSSGNDSLTVSSGNHTITVSAGKSDVTAATSITLTSGASTIKISPSGIEITAPQVKVTATATMTLQASASMTVNGGGSLALSAGMVSIN